MTRLALIALLAPAVAAFAAEPPAAEPPAPPPVAEAPVPDGGVEIRARVQESLGAVSRYQGDVELRTGGIVVSADEAEYNDDTGDLEARGSVHYRNLNGKEDLYASKLAYNVRTELGTFYEVHGTVASATQAGARVLTTDNPFYIDGEVVHRAGDRYVIHDGTVTNCAPDDGWWRLSSPKTTIRPGDSATIHNGVFRLKGAPIFYLPIYKASLERVPRRSGFLTPNAGNSSLYGAVLGQSYYWAINRSYDATITGTLYTSRGLATTVGFRGRPTRNSHFDATFFGVEDRGLLLDNGERLKQGGESLSFDGVAKFPKGFRGVADINLLSSLEFRQAFTQSYEAAVLSQVRSIGFVSKNFSTFSINASLLRDENFTTSAREDTVVIRKLPNLEFNSRERRLFGGPAPVYVGLDSSFDLVGRTQPTIKTRRYLQRGDLHPRAIVPLSWQGWHVTPTFGARLTGYGQSFNDNRQIVGQNLYRATGEIGVDIAPPALQRVYNGPGFLGQKVKHVIEPRIRYRYLRGVSDFQSVVRFDDRDILNNTNEVDISLTQRLYAKSADGRTREVLALEIAQRRYFDSTFGDAVEPGRRNVLRSSLSLTPFAFINEPRTYSPVAVSLRARPTWKAGLEWRTDYDPLREKIVNSSVQFDYLIHPLLKVGVQHNAVRVPDALSPDSNQITALISVGEFNRRGWNFAAMNIYDYRQQLFLYSASQVSYNTDCCGFGVEVRRFAIGNRRQEIRVSLSIANIGSFGNLRPQERLF